MDFFDDPRVRSAEDRHSKRRRRAGAVFDTLNGIFHLSLLVFVVIVVGKFAQLVLPRALGF
jgi:hypothetical protein